MRYQFNLNDTVYFELTEAGRDYVKKRNRELFAAVPNANEHADRATADLTRSGRTEFWHFCEIFAPEMRNDSNLAYFFVNGLNLELDASRRS